MIEEYLTHLQDQGKLGGTLRIRRVYLEQLRAEVPDLLTATPAILRNFLALRRPLWTDSTMNVATAGIRGLYTWLHNEGRIPKNPSKDLSYIKASLPVGRIASDSCITAGLACATPRQRLAILLMSEAGLRRSEVATLPANARQGEWLRIFGKGSKWRTIPTTPSIRAALDECLPVGGWYFPGRTSGHINDGTIAYWCRDLVKMPPHSLRRRYATTIYKATHDIRTVAMLLGHSNTLVTERYIGVGMDVLMSAAQTGILLRDPAA